LWHSLVVEATPYQCHAHVRRRQCIANIMKDGRGYLCSSGETGVGFCVLGEIEEGLPGLIVRVGAGGVYLWRSTFARPLPNGVNPKNDCNSLSHQCNSRPGKTEGRPPNDG
jgi:hypothetical protein